MPSMTLSDVADKRLKTVHLGKFAVATNRFDAFLRERKRERVSALFITAVNGYAR